jgi:cytochrome c biogenesis protein CcdA
MKKVFSLKVLFVVNAIFALVGGLGEALAPQQFVGSFVSSLDSSGAFMAQNTGVFQTGTAIISFLARNIQDGRALKAILGGFTLIHTGVVLVAVQHMVSMRAVSSDGVGDLVIHGLLAIGFGYFLFAESRPNDRAAARRGV